MLYKDRVGPHLQDLDLLPEQVLALGEILFGDGFDGDHVTGAL